MNNIHPVSQVLLRINKAQQDEIITDSGVKLFINPDYNKEWNVAVTAKIAALPIKVSPKHKYILDSLKVGDEVAMSYRVVADFEFKSDGERFMPTTEDNPLMREYVNAKGEWVKVYALPGIISKIWVGVYQDKNREVISGVEGSESEMERWLSQFQLGKTDIYTFNNMFEYNGKTYWKADIDDIFAKKVKGEWVAVGDRIICKPIDEKIPQRVLVGNELPDGIAIRYQDRGRVVTGGLSKKLKKGTIIGFNPRYLEKYDFDNKQYFLINKELVDSKWN